uniref:Uncharacterized protein n=1 Tax=Chromera velia CCMP2878 TaxID=1169474 RepID=A0A0G4F6D0_9ALVE|eukprot:Cvel_2772.t1-p1 / transcript=Cvel_2772.t1 / gene=Cvel_2772 / organism=Chromera_velia_CCMP2878 / gene_product=hypothetical protein / transcript_product=hypothetical protein / location=Cvel_scaffold111:79947-84156(+) / protein_length=175 / sequence_SO=supercontig / SO=protein_coding / is_pseudo=false
MKRVLGIGAVPHVSERLRDFIIDGENVGELLDPNAQNNPNLQTIERGRKLKLPAWQACQLSNWGAVQILRPEFSPRPVSRISGQTPQRLCVQREPVLLGSWNETEHAHVNGRGGEIHPAGTPQRFPTEMGGPDRQEPTLSPCRPGISAERGFAQKLSIGEEASQVSTGTASGRGK